MDEPKAVDINRFAIIFPSVSNSYSIAIIIKSGSKVKMKARKAVTDPEDDLLSRADIRNINIIREKL
jgi:hypothetical protein